MDFEEQRVKRMEENEQSLGEIEATSKCMNIHGIKIPKPSVVPQNSNSSLWEDKERGLLQG